MADKSIRSLSIPTNFTELGGVFRIGSRAFRVVPKVIELPCEACSGCAFGGLAPNGSKESCPNQQCSPSDRKDRTSVWFVEEKSNK